MFTWASESQPGTSADVVESASSMRSSPQTSRTISSTFACTGSVIGALDGTGARDAVAAPEVERPHRPGAVVGGRVEAHALVQVRDHGVLRRGDVAPAQAGAPAPGGFAADASEQRVLDRAPDHAAAHEERLDVELAVVGARDQHGDEPVVGEAVAQLEVQRDVIGVLGDPAQ